jgi:hypothetical protein
MSYALSEYKIVKMKRLNEALSMSLYMKTCMASEEKETYNFVRAFQKMNSE